MSERSCDVNEAMAAVSYLRTAFSGWSQLSDQQERAYLRLFRTCSPAELRQAIDELVMAGGGRRPAPADVGERVQMVRKAARLSAANAREPWPDVTPADVKRHLDAIRKQLTEKGAR